MRRFFIFSLLVFAGISCVKKSEIPSSGDLPCSKEVRLKAALASELVTSSSQLENPSQTTLDSAVSHSISAVSEAFDFSKNCADFEADSLLADACYRLGSYFHSLQKFNDARTHFEQGLALRLRMYPAEKNHKDILRLYFNLGSCWQKEGKLELAMHYFDLASEKTKTSNPSPFIPSLIALGDCHLELKELTTAEKYLLEAKSYIEKESSKPIQKRMPRVLVSLSDCYRLMHRYSDAITVGEQGIDFIRKNDSLQIEPVWLPLLYLNLGNAWQDSFHQIQAKDALRFSEAKDNAVHFTELALETYRKLEDPFNMGTAWQNLGELHRRAGFSDKAVSILSHALQDTSLQKYPKLLARLHINRGEAWLDQENFERALDDFNRSSRKLVPGWQPAGGQKLPPLNLPVTNRSDLLLNLSDIASAHLQWYRTEKNPSHLEAAAAAYDSLLLLANHIRGDFLSSDAKLLFAGELKDHLRKAFQVSLALHREKPNGKYLERAFRLSEQSKAVALLEAVRLNHFSSSLPKDIQNQEEKLQKRRAEIENELFEQGAQAERKAELQNQWLENFEDWRKFQEKLKTSQPAYFQLRYAGADLTIADLQKNLLADDQGLIEYFFNDSVLHVFLVTRENFTLKSVPVASNFPAEMDSLLRLVSNHQSSPEENNRLCLAANQAWKTLLAPLGTLPKRLIIVPDPPFQLLPFEALLTGDGGNDLAEQVENQNFVLFKHDVSYCFSGNLLALMKRDDGVKSLKKAVAAFAPNFPEKLRLPARMPAQMTPEDVGLLKPIQNQDEVQAIERQACSKIYPKDLATKDAFFEACKKYSVVHAATHGFLNHREPNFNFIAFNQTDSFDARQILKLSELNAQEIQSELIVFSACETAAGKNVEGEGTMSMARGLAYAGVNSLISTLFLVRAQNNSDIFSRFYQSIAAKKNGLEMDGALAEAKRQFAMSSSNNYHPANWAAVVLIGDAKPPEIESADDCGGSLFHPAWLG
ncbi:MAG: CHAT domain-containing protein, partial [Bacteroidota bacterium]